MTSMQTSTTPSPVDLSDVARMTGSVELACSKCGQGFLCHRTRLRKVCYDCEPVVAESPRAKKYKRDTLKLLADAGVNVFAFKDATLDNFDPTDDPTAKDRVVEWMTAYMEANKPYPSRPWLYLYGADSKVLPGGTFNPGRMGNGKTHLAVAALRALVEGETWVRSFRFVTSEELLLLIEATYKNDSSDSVSKLLRVFADYELLVVDDFGARKVTDHVGRIFLELLTRRQSRATILTSNVGLRQLNQLPDMKRIVSRIAGETQQGHFVVGMKGRDRRLA